MKKTKFFSGAQLAAQADEGASQSLEDLRARLATRAEEVTHLPLRLVRQAKILQVEILHRKDRQLARLHALRDVDAGRPREALVVGGNEREEGTH